jgi:hypothetical protein
VVTERDFAFGLLPSPNVSTLLLCPSSKSIARSSAADSNEYTAVSW